MIGLKSKSNFIILTIFVLTTLSLFAAMFLFIKGANVDNHVKILALYESKVKQDKIKQINVTKQIVVKKLSQENVKLQQKKLEENNNKLNQLKTDKEVKDKVEKELKEKLASKNKNETSESSKQEQKSQPEVTSAPVENGDIASQLSASGLGGVQVDAIIANLRRESTLNPNANNGVGNEGLAQWGGGRLNSLKATCGGLGSASCQINFMISEMKSGINGFSLQQFNTYKDVNSANSYFKARYECAA